MKVIFSERFERSLSRIKKKDPRVLRELSEAVSVILELGQVPVWYNPHYLEKPGAKYTGLQEFHLAESKFDVLVVFTQRGAGLDILFIDIGSHEDLFD